MKVLSQQQFRDRKKSNRLVIYGSGGSINAITDSQSKLLNERDSLAFNWFCKHKTIVPSFFLIREQANIPKRVTKDETPQLLIDLINKRYRGTCFVVHDLSEHSPHAFPYHTKTALIEGDGVIVKDRQKGSLKQNLYDEGVYHGATTLMNTLHVAGFLGYEEVLFAGVDLYDSRYFWLPQDKARENIQKKGCDVNDTHPVAKNALDAVKQFMEVFPDVKLRCLNPKSLLRKVMDCERI
jgi:hypothetical protein